jgi:hypothetical protein
VVQSATGASSIYVWKRRAPNIHVYIYMDFKSRNTTMTRLNNDNHVPDKKELYL